ncbi:MAG: GDP-L-fucose synthase, partial [Oscillospiraceae bacterium]|nr:GDP-L-fucose synthase [Oscillospiraceae bacterium]
MVGSAIERALRAAGYGNIITRTSKELDLRCQSAVREFFEAERPELVFVAAARVGGIAANMADKAGFLYDNLAIEMNLINSAYETGVKKLLFLGSSCIYPRMAKQPIKEDELLRGSLEETNEGYALAKIAGLKYCEYLNKERGANFISAMPCNLYGPGDNYHPEHSHVLPALIRRFHEAKLEGAPGVAIWGTGTPLREFLYVDDLAEACVFLTERYS